MRKKSMTEVIGDVEIDRFVQFRPEYKCDITTLRDLIHGYCQEVDVGLLDGQYPNDPGPDPEAAADMKTEEEWIEDILWDIEKAAIRYLEDLGWKRPEENL